MEEKIIFYSPKRGRFELNESECGRFINSPENCNYIKRFLDCNGIPYYECEYKNTEKYDQMLVFPKEYNTVVTNLYQQSKDIRETTYVDLVTGNGEHSLAAIYEISPVEVELVKRNTMNQLKFVESPRLDGNVDLFITHDKSVLLQKEFIQARTYLTLNPDYGKMLEYEIAERDRIFNLSRAEQEFKVFSPNFDEGEYLRLNTQKKAFEHVITTPDGKEEVIRQVSKNNPSYFHHVAKMIMGTPIPVLQKDPTLNISKAELEKDLMDKFPREETIQYDVIKAIVDDVVSEVSNRVYEINCFSQILQDMDMKEEVVSRIQETIPIINEVNIDLNDVFVALEKSSEYVQVYEEKVRINSLEFSIDKDEPIRSEEELMKELQELQEREEEAEQEWEV